MGRSATSRLPKSLRTLGQAVLLLAVVELVLAGLDVADRAVADADRLPYQRLDLPLFEARDGRFVAHERRLGSQSFPVEKESGEVRVFLLGGSALRGLGYSPGIAIASLLERCLQELDPERRYRAINGGIVGISSDEVRRMCADVLARYEPDAIVVCSGNNEFLALHAREFQRLERGPVARALGRFTAHLRLLHVLRGFLPAPERRATAADDDAVRMTAGFFLDTVRLTPADVRGVVEAHRANLAAVAELCRAAGVPLFVATVPANLRWGERFLEDDWQERWLAAWDLPPEAWPPPGDERIAFLLAGAEAREADADPLERTALALLRGRCHEATGAIDAAHAAYLEAIEVDPHHRRTLAAMNASIRTLAGRDGVFLADTVTALEALEPIPDTRFFYDHIHYNPEGAATVAALFAERLAAAELVPALTAGDPRDCRERELARFRERLAAGLDAPEVERYVGFDFDPAFVADPDLWKYDRGLERLLAMVGSNELGARARGRALTWLGNHRAFEAGGEERARRHWEEALPLVPEWADALRANLAWLETR